MSTCPDAGANLDIRRAGPADTVLLQELYVEAARWRVSQGILLWDEKTFTQEYIAGLMADYELFIAYSGGEAAGCFTLQWSDKSLWGERDRGDAGYLHRLVVTRKLSGLRLGTRLLEWAESYIRRAGKTYFRLDCMSENSGLNAYYRNAGFVYLETVPGDGWSANLYEKKL
ncbi:GNAT family N-acetyltransferase [Paenibacillus chitinolyticus]|uniref:GNAT family N-acetyltransferase n=1 Tax=Paenibacillus chitinolyticus TaxID=79263 RepID=UPI002DB94B9A|nr:GNAT family N-acetyltransferase [Paenibacillus chitinolyticus]MEC0246460.1 GNAT family N-acetyltransferase [Paenibacillus chitinolyticus]